MRNATLTFLLLLCSAAAFAAEPLLVDSAWLVAHLDDPKLVLLHVGDREEYAKQHIRGARLVSQNDLSASDHTAKGLMLEMLPEPELRARLEKLGISDDSRIVVYYASDWVSPATRILFTLDHAGLGARTSLLDGGMRDFVRAGGPVTRDVPSPKPGKLSTLKFRPTVVDAAFVRAHLRKPGFRVIDGRAGVFFDGLETGGMHAKDKTGHIAGAGSIPFTSIVDERGFVRPKPELQALFTKAGVQRGDTVIGYCHIGQQTTAMLFAARLLGHNVLLYDGSMQDWSREARNPVENPSAKGSR